MRCPCGPHGAEGEVLHYVTSRAGAKTVTPCCRLRGRRCCFCGGSYLFHVGGTSAFIAAGGRG